MIEQEWKDRVLRKAKGRRGRLVRAGMISRSYSAVMEDGSRVGCYLTSQSYRRPSTWQFWRKVSKMSDGVLQPRRPITLFLLVSALALVLPAQETELHFSGDDLFTNAITSDVLFGAQLDSSDQVTGFALVDGKIILSRLGGEYCGGSFACAVHHSPGYNHCSPYREVYGVRDGEILLLETIHPEIVAASPRQVIWPDTEVEDLGDPRP